MSAWADPELDGEAYRQLIDPTFDPAAEAAEAYRRETERLEAQARADSLAQRRRFWRQLAEDLSPIALVIAFGSLVWALCTVTH